MLGLNPSNTARLLRGRGKMCVYKLVREIGRGISSFSPHLSVTSAFSEFASFIVFQKGVVLSPNFQWNSHSDTVWMIPTECTDIVAPPTLTGSFLQRLTLFWCFLPCRANYPWYLSWQLNIRLSLLLLSLTISFTTSSTVFQCSFTFLKQLKLSQSLPKMNKWTMLWT